VDLQRILADADGRALDVGPCAKKDDTNPVLSESFHAIRLLDASTIY
jgi:hypothetical protein